MKFRVATLLFVISFSHIQLLQALDLDTNGVSTALPVDDGACPAGCV